MCIADFCFTETVGIFLRQELKLGLGIKLSRATQARSSNKKCQKHNWSAMGIDMQIRVTKCQLIFKERDRIPMPGTVGKYLKSLITGNPVGGQGRGGRKVMCPWN